MDWEHLCNLTYIALIMIFSFVILREINDSRFMKTYLGTLSAFALLLFLLPATAFSQAGELKTLFGQLEQQVLEVQTGNNTYQQSLTLEDPCVLRYEYTQTDAKGKTAKHAFEFNLADIDANAVREETKKDMIVVNLSVKGGQKLVKEYKDGAVQGYAKDVVFIGKDVDNARQAKELFKKAIPLAEKAMENKLKIAGYDDMIRWLTAHVKDAEAGDKSYKQSLTAGKEHVGSLEFVQTEASAKTPAEEQYVFNLADINPHTLSFKITGNKFLLTFETLRKQKTVSYSKNGVPGSFTKDVEIVTSNVEDARDLKTVLALAIPLAQEKVKSAMPVYKSQQEALDAIAKLVETVKDGDKQLEQTFTPSCVATFVRVEQAAKATTKHEYQFNLLDLNESVLDYEVSGSSMYVQLLTKDKTKLVKYQKGDELSAYESDFRIYTSNVEVARRLKHALSSAITSCRNGHSYPFKGLALKDRISWLSTTIGEVSLEGKSFQQKLELVDPADLKKFKFTRVEIDSKKSTEEVFEFNLTDINPKAVTYSVKGKWLSFVIETNHKDKIIKYYQNGEIKPYTNTIEFKVNDIEKARNLIAAFSGAITEVK